MGHQPLPHDCRIGRITEAVYVGHTEPLRGVRTPRGFTTWKSETAIDARSGISISKVEEIAAEGALAMVFASKAAIRIA
jgi:hypothetical protein